jgi:hypothetical protein
MQYYTMMVYCGILQKRIAKFPSWTNPLKLV